jgi:zinc protease
MDPGLLQVYAIAAPGVQIGTLEQEIWEVIEEMKHGAFDKGELAKAKRGLIASFIMGMQSIFFQGLGGGLYEIKAGDCGMVNTVLDRCERITTQAVQEVAKKYLHEDNRTVVTLQPITPEENEGLEPVE